MSTFDREHKIPKKIEKMKIIDEKQCFHERTNEDLPDQPGARLQMCHQIWWEATLGR